MTSSKDSLVKRSTRQIISDAESTLHNLKNSDLSSPHAFEKFSDLDRLISEIESLPGSSLYKTLKDQLREYSSSLLRTKSSQPRGKSEPPISVREPLKTPQVEFFSLTQNESAKFYHTYQKEGFTGEYSTCNGTSETISQTDLLSLVQKENMEIMNRTIDLNHLSFDIGFSPPFSGGGGVFIIRLDRGLDRANRPSNFEYWYFLVDTESDKLLFLDLIQKTYIHVYGKPNKYLDFMSNAQPNLEVIESLFIPGKYFFNSEEKYWSKVRNICTLIQKVPMSWLPSRIWYWLSDGHHSSQVPRPPPKRENLSPRLDAKVLVELVNTEFDIRFGDYKTITAASHNLKLHNQICNVFADSSALLQFYRNINYLDSFIDAIIRTNPGASTDNLASLLMFNWFGLLSVEQSIIEELHGFIKTKSSFNWSNFLSKHLGPILELAPDNSIGISGLESLGKLKTIPLDRNINFLLNYTCWNSVAVNWLKDRNILNNIDTIISEKIKHIEDIDSELNTMNTELKSAEMISTKYSQIKENNDYLLTELQSLSSDISGKEDMVLAFRKTPNLLYTISHYSTHLEKPILKEIRRLKPRPLRNLFKRGSKIQKKNQSAQLRSFFYLHYWNHLINIGIGKDLALKNKNYKKLKLNSDSKVKELQELDNKYPSQDINLNKLKSDYKNLQIQKTTLEKELNSLNEKKNHQQN